MKRLHERIIAFYLPQFHPIPENNERWGPGFTEWNNVVKGRPLYPGHYQPRLPADLGFYDLRVPEVRVEQARLARQGGIEGFCYWHYWFGDGRRVLERPLDEVIKSGEPDFPFCLAWANHSWTGKWYGKPNVVWIEQKYPGRTDEEAHFDWALRAFRDRRYMKVNGKPIFCILSPHLMPSSAAFIAHWRKRARQARLPGIYFVGISHAFGPGIDPYRAPIFDPFDAVTRLVPLDYVGPRRHWKASDLYYRWKTRDFVTRYTPWALKYKRPLIFEYSDVVARTLNDIPDEPKFLPQILPGWDDTPRYGQNGVVYDNATPELFARHLAKAIAIVKNRPQEEAIIFIKAWNEWAEGNYLEPDTRYGHAYLEAMRNTLALDQVPSGDLLNVR
jgi:hypothetical protein